MAKMIALLGRKIGMSQAFSEGGEVLPITALELGPCTVVQVKTPDKEGYAAIQIGYEDIRPERVNQPRRGHFEKHGVSPKRVLREIRVPVEALEEYSPGQELRVERFSVGDVVDVVGTSKGRGTAGVMKRWGFAGAKASHGVHEKKRHGGAAGMGAYPARTPKGFKMPGRMGSARVTVKNLSVVEVHPEKNVLMVKGAVPGHRRALVLVQSAKTPKKKPAPPEE
ncbi:MAG: 50S ribosomal protein L3 [Planctomycetota bacterium]|jgi:large subunit ribosomal protein L3